MTDEEFRMECLRLAVQSGASDPAAVADHFAKYVRPAVKVSRARKTPASPEERAAASARLRALNADPAFVAKKIARRKEQAALARAN